jgi:hypothetical protein
VEKHIWERPYQIGLLQFRTKHFLERTVWAGKRCPIDPVFVSMLETYMSTCLPDFVRI